MATEQSFRIYNQEQASLPGGSSSFQDLESSLPGGSSSTTCRRIHVKGVGDRDVEYGGSSSTTCRREDRRQEPNGSDESNVVSRDVSPSTRRTITNLEVLIL